MFSKILGTISTQLGEAERPVDLPYSQQVKWTMPHSAHLAHSGVLLYTCGYLSHLWFVWPEPFSQQQEDGTTFNEPIADPRLKQ